MTTIMADGLIIASNRDDFIPFCRLCLKKVHATVLQNLSTDADATSVILNNILECTGLKLNPFKNQDDHICIECIEMLDKCSSFIKKCRLNNQSDIIETSVDDFKNTTKSTNVFFFDSLQDELQHLDEAEILNDLEKLLNDPMLDDVQNRDIIDTEISLIDKQIPEDSIEQESDETQNNDASKHKCLICNEIFKTKGRLLKHKQTHSHSKSKQFICALCGKHMLNEESLKKHISCIHGDDKKYECNQCGQRYGSLSGLQYHAKAHKNERNHVCSVCGAAFIHRSSLDTHLGSHTDKKLPCKVCKKLFSSKHNLRRHQLIHGERKYSCDVCGKKFINSTHLKIHMVLHTGEKPYKCNLCEQSFSFACQKRIHIKKMHLLC